MLAYECTCSFLVLGLEKICSHWWDAHNLHIKVFQQMKNYFLLNHWINCSSPMFVTTRSIISILFWLRGEFENCVTTIITTNSISEAAGPLDHRLEKCKCTSRKVISYFRETWVEILTLSLKYPTICKNLF